MHQPLLELERSCVREYPSPKAAARNMLTVIALRNLTLHGSRDSAHLRESLSAVRNLVYPPMSRRAQIMCIFVCSPLYGELGQHGLSMADAFQTKTTSTSPNGTRSRITDISSTCEVDYEVRGYTTLSSSNQDCCVGAMESRSSVVLLVIDVWKFLFLAKTRTDEKISQYAWKWASSQLCYSVVLLCQTRLLQTVFSSAGMLPRSVHCGACEITWESPECYGVIVPRRNATRSPVQAPRGTMGGGMVKHRSIFAHAPQN